MSGYEEFDWGRMRQEEDNYFAAKVEPKTSGATARAVILRMIDHAEGNKDPLVAWLRSLPYSEFLQTDYWHKARVRALVRDGHQCRICASRKDLEVHHLTYERLGEELAADLITLCAPCHRAMHNTEG